MVCKVFKFFNLVDSPDGGRKIHKGEIATSGGLSIFLSISIISFLFYEAYFPGALALNDYSIIWLISIIILIMGLVDDKRPLTPFIRLFVQIFASWLVIIFTDVYIKDFGNLLGLGNIFIGEIGLPITIFMIVGICNAFNMIDGMDGFVGFTVLILCLTLGILGLDDGYYALLVLTPICLCSFLIYNLGLLGRSVKIFLGDSGSMWIGFIIGWYLIILSQGENNLIQPVTALWLVLLPLIDALSTFLRRLVKRKSLFLGDRSHFHHMLLDAGFDKWKVLLTLIGFSLSASGFVILFWMFDIEEYYQFYGFLTVWVLYALFLKYPLLKTKDI